MLAAAAALAILALVAPALAQTPEVSLLTDLPLYASTGRIHIRDLLPLVSLRKGAPFRFGSTHDVWTAEANWTSAVFRSVFNHVVAENGCKWYDTEPERGVSNVSDCAGVSQFAAQHGATFRGYVRERELSHASMF